MLFTYAVCFLTMFLASITYILRSVKNRTMWQGPTLPSDEEMPPNDHVQMTRLPVLGTKHVAVYASKKIDKDRPWILYCHGVMNHCESEQNLQVFQKLPNLVMWDYRGFGRSTGQSDETVVLYDLFYVIRWMRSADGLQISPLQNIYLGGSSLGANIVLSYLRYMQDSTYLPHGVFLIHPLCRISDVLKMLGAPETIGLILGNMDVGDSLKKYLHKDKSRTALVLGSNADTVTPWESTSKIADECPNTQIVEIGGNHFTAWTDRSITEIINFTTY